MTCPYLCANFVLHSNAVYTNTTPGGAFRGFGVPQIVWAVESMMDVAADRLGRDPVDLRRGNLLAHGEEFAPATRRGTGKLQEGPTGEREATRGSARPRAGRPPGARTLMKAAWR